MPSLLTRAESLQPWLVERRRRLHEQPELSYQEERTAAFVAAELRALGVEPLATGLNGNHSLVAELPGEDDARVIALRADMDALPIQELVDWPHRSRVDGVAHLCGHDAHTTMLLGAVKLLVEGGEKLPCRVRLFFQGGEEKFPGGANDFIKTGWLDGVERVFGQHVDPRVDVGVARSAVGPVMAGVNEFTITVRGVGGHAAFPHATRDPILASAHVVTALQQAVSRREDPLAPGVLSVTTIHAGTAFNVIPGEVVMTGTARSFRPDMRDFYGGILRETAENVARAFGCEATVYIPECYTPLIHVAEWVDAGSALAAVVLPVGLGHVDPVMGSEDFALYTAQAPAAFVFVGCSAPDDRERFMLHHPRFRLDEGVLSRGAALLAGVALAGGRP